MPVYEDRVAEARQAHDQVVRKGLWSGLCLNYPIDFRLKLAATTEAVSRRPS